MTDNTPLPFPTMEEAFNNRDYYDLLVASWYAHHAPKR